MELSDTTCLNLNFLAPFASVRADQLKAVVRLLTRSLLPLSFSALIESAKSVLKVAWVERFFFTLLVGIGLAVYLKSGLKELFLDSQWVALHQIFSCFGSGRPGNFFRPPASALSNFEVAKLYVKTCLLLGQAIKVETAT